MIALEAAELTRQTILSAPPVSSISYPLYVQLVRSLSSVGANYVEGHAKVDIQDLIRFMKTARGSAYESLYHAELLQLQTIDKIRALCIEVDQAIVQIIDDCQVNTEAAA